MSQQKRGPAPATGARPSPNNITATTTDALKFTVRCPRCRRPLRTDVAVLRGCGWRCYRETEREVGDSHGSGAGRCAVVWREGHHLQREQKTSRVLFMNLLSFFENFSGLSRRVKSVGRALGRRNLAQRRDTCVLPGADAFDVARLVD